VARLVLINGAPGSGKSTLARRYADDHPLTLVLDIDQVRGMLGRWMDASADAGRLARGMAVAMARVHLESGHDVVVPQFLGRLDLVQRLQQLCEDTATDFIEVALLSSPQDAADRFTRRSAQPDSAEHRDAAELLDRSGGLGEMPEIYRRLLEVVAARPDTRTITTVDGEIDQAYRDLLTAVRAGQGRR
jgi:predicted kinase